MNVTGINSFKNSQNKSSVRNTHKAANPSFGWLLKPEETKLLTLYLPKNRRDFFDKVIMTQITTPDKSFAKQVSDNLLKKALFEAKLYKAISNVTTKISNLFVPMPKKAA